MEENFSNQIFLSDDKSTSSTGESVESNIEFEGISPDVDPDEEMVVMKGFVMKTERLVIEPVEQSPDNNNSIHRSATYPNILKPSNLPSVIPIIKVSDELEKKASHTELSGCAEEIRKKCNSRVSIFEGKHNENSMDHDGTLMMKYFNSLFFSIQFTR